MNKLISKIVGAVLGLTLAVGTGVAVAANGNSVSKVNAATIASWSAASEGFTNQKDVSGTSYSFDDPNVTISFGTKVGNGHVYYTSGGAVRSYASNSFTIACSAGNLTSITLSNDQSKTVTASVGTYSNNSWSGSSSSVTFTVASGSGNFRTSTVSATYENGGAQTELSVEINPSNCGWSAVDGGEAQTGTSVDGFTASCTKGYGSTSEMRIYKSNTITITSETYAITKIVFTCIASGTTKYGPGCFATQDGYSYSGTLGTWIGIAGSVSFTASSEQVRTSKIVITYSTTAAALSVEPNDLVLAPTDTKTLTASVVGGSGDIEWATNDSSIVSISAATGSSIMITAEDLGKATITATYSTAKPVKIEVTVYELSGSGTQADPYTPSDVYFLASQLDIGSNNGQLVYATGTVTEVTYFDNQNNIASFKASDGTRTITAYSINGSSQTLIDNNYVGANCQVVISGVIINHASGGYEIGYASGYSSNLVSSNKGALTTVSAELVSETHAVGSTLSASDFKVSLTYALNVTGTITSGFTWTVNGTDGTTTQLIEGDNNIIVSFDGVNSTTIALPLSLVHVTSVEMTTSDSSILVGGSIQLEATILPAGYVDTVTWSSDDEDVATVSSSGLVTGVSSGTATITVEVNNFSDSVTITVVSAVKYSKISSETSDLSGKYVIVSEANNVAFDASLEKLDAVSNYKTAEDSDNSVSVLDTFFVTLAKVEGGYSIQTTSGLYIGQTKNDNGLASSTSTAYANTVSFDDNGNANISCSGAYLRYNKTSGQTRFRYFKSSSYTAQETIQLYRIDMLESWIESYMHMNDSDYEGDGTGLCQSAGTYLTAKSALSGLGEVYITQFKDGVQSAYASALARYQAWATACGDTTPFDGTSSINSAHGMQLASMNSNGLIIVIITAFVTTTFVGGYFFLRKKKEN